MINKIQTKLQKNMAKIYGKNLWNEKMQNSIILFHNFLP